MLLKQKILYLTFHPNIGGGETTLLSLISKLDKTKYDPFVVVTANGQLKTALSKLKIKTFIIPLNGYFIRTLFMPGISPSGILALYKLARKIKPNLIHVNHLNLAIYAGIVSKLLKIPTIATAHGKWDSIYIFQDIITRFFINKVLAISPFVAKHLKDKGVLTSKQIETVPLAVDTNVFKPGNKRQSQKTLNLPKNKFIFTLVARLDPIKDHITFLKAAKIVLQQESDVAFYIVGSKAGDFSGQGNNYSKQIDNYLKRNANLKDKVILGGFQSFMPTVYRATDILVCSSKEESLSISMMEGAACALPLISTNRGGSKLIVKEGLNGYLVPPQNPDLLAQKMLKLKKDKGLRELFSKNSLKIAKSYYDISRYVKRLETIYGQFLTRE